MAGYLTHRREPQCPLCAALRRQIPLEIMGCWDPKQGGGGWVINGIRARHGECANRQSGTRKGEVKKDVIGLAISRLASRRPDDNEPWYLRMMHRLFVSKPHPLARQMLIRCSSSAGSSTISPFRRRSARSPEARVSCSGW